MKYLFLVTLIGLYSCKSSNNKVKSNESIVVRFTPQYIPGPAALVYKTKADYSNFVPVILSENKLEIISYPDPKDINSEGSYPFPTVLNQNYLLDNKGININIAYLKYTYEEYSKLDSLPSAQELYQSIIEINPLTELCDCGNKAVIKDIEKQINLLIDSNLLRLKCKVIK